jgi:hypothetical protein
VNRNVYPGIISPIVFTHCRFTERGGLKGRKLGDSESSSLGGVETLDLLHYQTIVSMFVLCMPFRCFRTVYWPERNLYVIWIGVSSTKTLYQTLWHSQHDHISIPSRNLKEFSPWKRLSLAKPSRLR